MLRIIDVFQIDRYNRNMTRMQQQGVPDRDVLLFTLAGCVESELWDAALEAAFGKHSQTKVPDAGTHVEPLPDGDSTNR